MEHTTSALVFLLFLVSAAGAQLLFAGDRCNTENGQSGVCKRIDSCPSAKEDFNNGMSPTICSFEKRTPVVCCASGTTTTTNTTTTTTITTTTTRRPPVIGGGGGGGGGQKARRMCVKYAEAVWQRDGDATLALEDDDEPAEPLKKSECGVQTIVQLFVGEAPVLPKEFPHQAAVGFGDDSNIEWLCGGTLISDRYVLTAAHCTSANGKGAAKWVRLGDFNLRSDVDDARPVNVAVAERIRHPNYRSLSNYNDIALLRLERKVKFNPYMRPACLNVDRHITTAKFIASGWGRIDWANENGSDELMKVQLSAVSNANCSKAYRSLMGTGKLKFGIQDDKMLCAGEKDGGRDTCRGDSGGPLQYVLKEPYCMYGIVGLTSFGSTVCGASNSPAVYTRVSNYISWIESKVWP